MKRLILTMVCATGFVAATNADRVETAPQGLVQIQVDSKSEMLVGSPFHQTAVYVGTVEAVVDEWLSPSLGDNQSLWSEGQWAASEAGNPRYYVLVTSGYYEGFVFSVNTNIESALELDISGVEAEMLEGSSFKLIPYWTLDTLFGAQAQLGAATIANGKDATSSVQLFSLEPKINKKPEYSFYYYEGNTNGGPGWRMKGAAIDEIFNDMVIAPGDCVLIQNLGSESMSLSFPGNVQFASNTTIVTDYGRSNDEYFTSVSATPTSLSESKLYESGAFLGTRIISGARGDLLMIFDGSKKGMPKASSEIYYYYTGTAFGGEGWRKKGSPLTQKFDDAIVFEPGYGFAIRKTVSEGEGDYIWSFYPEYASAE